MAEQSQWVRRPSVPSRGRAASVSIPRSPGERYDAATREPIEGRPHKGDHIWGNVAAKFIKSPPGGCLQGNWIGVRPLGKGGFGLAGLWEKRNEDGRVVDVRLLLLTESAYY